MISAQRIIRPYDRHGKRKGVALLATMLLIMLLVAVTAQLVTVTSTAAILASRRQHSLAHELAVNSALLVVADRLTGSWDQGADLLRALDQVGMTKTSFEIGRVMVNCTISDDATKLNPLLFQRPDQQAKLTRKLAGLAVRRKLPTVTIALKPVLVDSSSPNGPLYHWYDQILGNPQPCTIFDCRENAEHEPVAVWSDVVTFWGDGRVDLRHVDVDVLEAVLEDIRPGLARELLAVRPADRSIDFLQTALTRADAEIRQRVAARLTFNARRYALRIDTAVGGDRRRWYVVARLAEDTLTILHRSQVTW